MMMENNFGVSCMPPLQCKEMNGASFESKFLNLESIDRSCASSCTHFQICFFALALSLVVKNKRKKCSMNAFLRWNELIVGGEPLQLS